MIPAKGRAMTSSPLSEVMQQLRRVMLLRDGAGLTDGQLLTDYLSRRDEAAFTALVRRHGPMVWGVCRRLLNHHDAEDAFQATFLVLVRKAASIMPRERVANWLYGVAHQTALQASRTAARRRAREKQVTAMPEPAVTDQDLWRDLQPLLDREVSRLPDAYREVVVLCDLEGKTRKEASQQLGLPEGTVGSRLARARTLLAKRLARNGLAVGGGALAAVLSQKAASECVPTSVVSSTTKAITLVAAGREPGAAISVQVAALIDGVLKTMLLSKLKAAVALVLVLGFVATGATALTYRTPPAQGDKPPTREQRVTTPQKPEREKQAFIAWGNEVGGLQAGLGLRPGEQRAYHPGETITLVVRVRNIGKEMVKFEYLEQFLDENPPTVRDAEGKMVPQVRTAVLGFHVPVEVSLGPGKEIQLKSRLGGASGVRYELRPESEREKGGSGKFPPLYVRTGKVSLQYERVFGNTSAGQIKLDPKLSKLATGKLEIHIKPAPTLR